MHIRKSQILFAVVLLVIIPISLWIYSNSISLNNITIRNNSKYYTASYHPTREFSQLITEWGIFKNGVLINGKQYTVKNLYVELTDTPQLLQTSDEISTNNSGIAYSLGDLTIYIYLSNSAIPDSDDIISDLFIQQLITQLYTLSHDRITEEELNSELLPIINNFMTNPTFNPFMVNYV